MQLHVGTGPPRRRASASQRPPRTARRPSPRASRRPARAPPPRRCWPAATPRSRQDGRPVSPVHLRVAALVQGETALARRRRLSVLDARRRRRQVADTSGTWPLQKAHLALDARARPPYTTSSEIQLRRRRHDVAHMPAITLPPSSSPRRRRTRLRWRPCRRSTARECRRTCRRGSRRSERMVSSSFTYLPGLPVKFSATWNGWPTGTAGSCGRGSRRSFCSSESSSMPRMAMMSCRSL